MTILILAYLLALVFTASVLLLYSVVVQPINCENTDLVIPQGSSLAYVIDELKRCKCIKNGDYFKYLMILTSKDTKIKPGTYDLSDIKNNYELSNLISSGTGEMIAVSSLEGWTIEQISKMFFRHQQPPLYFSKRRTDIFRSKQNETMNEIGLI